MNTGRVARRPAQAKGAPERIAPESMKTGAARITGVKEPSFTEPKAAQEIKETIVSGLFLTKDDFEYASAWGSFQDIRGGYIYKDWDIDHKKVIHRKITGIDPKILEVLNESDHEVCKGERKEEEHSDYRNQYNNEDEDDEGRSHLGAQVIASMESWMKDLIMEEAEPDMSYPLEELRSGFVAAENRKNNQKCQVRLEIIRQIVNSLDKDDRDLFHLFFSHCVTQKEYAESAGVGESAIGMRVLRLKAKIREVFTRLGYEVPTAEEIDLEMAERNKRQDEIRDAIKARRAEEEEIRQIHRIVVSESRMPGDASDIQSA